MATTTKYEGFSRDEMLAALDKETQAVKADLKALQDKGDNLSIADMFQMQMKMNHLAQLSEMSGSLQSASNAAISSLARNIKS